MARRGSVRRRQAEGQADYETRALLQHEGAHFFSPLLEADNDFQNFTG